MEHNSLLRLANAAVIVLFFLSGSAVAAVDVDELLKRCAPSVHPDTMRAVVSAESKGNVLAIADAGPLSLPWSERKSLVRSHFPTSVAEAVAIVKDLLGKGHTVSLGLAQINDRNLDRLGLSVEAVFDPCANVAAGASILSAFYVDAVKAFGPGPRALRAALSGYNSGSFVRGDRDGYVDIVYGEAGKPLVLKEAAASAFAVPAITTAMADSSRALRLTPTRGVVKSTRGMGRSEKDFTMQVVSFDEK